MKVLAIVPLIEICLGTAFNAAAISRGKEDYVDAIMMGLSSGRPRTSPLWARE